MITVIKFESPTCGKCTMIQPILDTIIAECGIPDIVLTKVNAYAETKLAQSYNVMTLPCIVIMKDGVEVNRIEGYKPKLIKDALAALKE